GQTNRRLPEIGSSLPRLLFRRLNEVLATALERDRRITAQVLSAEISLDRVHSVLQSLIEAVVVVDVVGEVVLTNAAAEDLLTASSDELSGKNLAALLQGEIGQVVSEGLVEAEECASGHARADGILWDDRHFDVLVVRVLSQRSGEDFGFVVVFMDVSNRFEVERAKNEFLSSVSHELRTPLTSICAYAEILGQMQPGHAEWEDFTRIILREGHRLARLVEGVLEYSQVEADDLAWQMEDVDLIELVEADARLLDPLCQERDIALRVELLPYAHVQADRSRLQKALANLLDNAIKFTPDGGRIRVRLEEQAGMARIDVQDSGPGIDEEEREEVFQCFRQIGDPLTAKPAGAGLGLALCRRIMERHQGKVSCIDPDPEYGGACLLLEIPLSQTPALAKS
ncbi:MAG: sensor histidine kinase, partial [Planctomycetota bacterium]